MGFKGFIEEEEEEEAEAAGTDPSEGQRGPEPPPLPQGRTQVKGRVSPGPPWAQIFFFSM